MSKRRIYLFSFGVWFVLLLIAVTTGAIRDALILPHFGEPLSHVVGTLVAISIMAAAIYLFFRRIAVHCAVLDFWVIGLLWLTMTISFEFLFFHFLMGKPLEELLADYNIFSGRLWLLVLAVTFFGPVIFGTICKKRTAKERKLE